MAVWIRKLIKEDKIARFYFTEEWKELRKDVLAYFHNECQECVKKGRYTKADCVHHCNEVKDRPDLALSRYYTDSKGQRQYNLIPLCNKCHNLMHEKLLKYHKAKNYINTEKW